MITKIKNYIQQQKNEKALEQERGDFMARFNASRQRVAKKLEIYQSYLESNVQREGEASERLIELAYGEYMLAVQEFEFLLDEARQSNIRAYWIDMVG